MTENTTADTLTAMERQQQKHQQQKHQAVHDILKGLFVLTNLANLKWKPGPDDVKANIILRIVHVDADKHLVYLHDEMSEDYHAVASVASSGLQELFAAAQAHPSDREDAL